MGHMLFKLTEKALLFYLFRQAFVVVFMLNTIHELHGFPSAFLYPLNLLRYFFISSLQITAQLLIKKSIATQ